MSLALTSQRRALITLAAALLAGCAEGDKARPGTRDDADPPIYLKLREASVKILVGGRMNGSGCFVNSDGLVLTASHVVKGNGANIEILSAVAGRLPAKRVAVDPAHDLALLTVDAANEPLPSLRIADRLPEPPASVLLFSSPLWRHDILLRGSVARSAPSYCWQPSLKCYVRCFYVAGASPVGSSGGCWVDSAGSIVGVQAGYLNNNDKSPVGIAFAAPLDAIRELLKTRRSRVTATLGGALDELWTQSAGFISRSPEGTRGIVTPVLHEGGPLEKAGLTRETIITAIDGKPVSFLDPLLESVRSKKPGQEIRLTVIEPIGKPEREVTVRLGEIDY
ncbi:MAG: S1C family serine protease [Planctomycetota bacterium]|jgi:S1-C subfamily serine protease